MERIMPVKVKDMVRKAEISPSTVSRALKSHLPIARVPAQRIQWLARDNHCVRSQFTRSRKTSCCSS
jgi:DNA-binding LacI/PurR family transcriptional regulator